MISIARKDPPSRRDLYPRSFRERMVGPKCSICAASEGFLLPLPQRYDPVVFFVLLTFVL